MAGRDLKNNVLDRVALDSQTIATNTTTDGNIWDLQGFESATFVFLSGAITDGAYVPLIQDGDDSGLSDAADVADAFLLGTEAAAAFALTDDDSTTRIGYVGKKRYVRCSLVSTGTSSGGVFAAILIKGHPLHAATS